MGVSGYVQYIFRLHISIYRNSIYPIFDLMGIMKRYQIDNDLSKPSWRSDEDKLNNANPKNRVCCKQIVRIFGEIHYTEKYNLISRKKLQKMKSPKQKRGSGR